MSEGILFWAGFIAFVLAMLCLDLGLFNKKPHAVKVREALLWSAVWIALALGFCALIHHWWGRKPALEFLTGYLIEESLSVDNLFVFLLLFSYFAVPSIYQHKVLFWGILGALVMRLAFILAGVELIHRLHWIIYIFGAFLVVTAVRMALRPDNKVDPEKNPVLRLVRRVLPITKSYEKGSFFVRMDGRILATPLFIVLVTLETTDLLFAVDSIPAVLSITIDPFIVFTSNVFAILGLRSLFFALAAIMSKFRHLRYGLAVVLGFTGAKMLLARVFTIPVAAALGVVAGVLALSVIASLIWPGKQES